MTGMIFILCALTSVGCALLLLRKYFRSPSGLLLWSSLCFSGFALNNILLFADYWAGPDFDLSLARGVCGLFAVAVLLYGLVWDTI